MAFEAYEIGLALIGALREPVAALQTRDPKLADQTRRAAQSIVLNLAEGRERTGRDRLHHYRISLGSAGELRAALDVALAWGYADAAAIAAALALLDRERAMLWRLAHPR